MALAAVALVACGDDEGDDGDADEAPIQTTPSTTEPLTDTTTAETTPASTAAPTTAAPTTSPASTAPATTPSADDTAAFCDSFVGVETAFQAAPSDDEAALGPYIETEIMPRLETLRANLPAEIADEVTVMADAVEAVATTGDFSAFESPEFAEAQAVVYPWLGDGCGLPVIEVAAVDYAFGGVPNEVDAGPTIFTLVNQSSTGESHEMGFARVNDDVDLTLDELLALPMEELEQSVQISGGVFAPEGESASSIIDLTEGRWMYVCFVPVGSVHGEFGSGPPHIMEGMSGELLVG
ncbi:MAG: hypothetical protein KDB37_10940 [Ilumatobacter sp.]|nr:hypothetical protein [Ilumatobacter sp.]